ncbi:MAG TPA: tetratricopeptide repeat protein [Planktothrix sp.]|jgi:tetratricopeptide (TPR) repeat protein
MNFAPYILQPTRSFRFATTKPLTECADTLQSIVGPGQNAGKARPLVGNIGAEGFTVQRRPGLAGMLFAPSFEGKYEVAGDNTDVVIKSSLNKVGKALLNAAINTILGAVIGVVVCLAMLPDAVAVSYAFLCMVLIPAFILVFATALGHFVIAFDTKFVRNLLSKQLGATQTEVPVKDGPILKTLLQEAYATPSTILLFILCAYGLHSVYAKFWAEGDYMKTAALTRPVEVFTSSLLGPKSFVAADCRYYLAESLRCAVRLREASELYEENTKAFKADSGPMAGFLASNYFGLARIEDEEGRHQDAEVHYQKAIDLWSADKSIGANNPWAAKGLDRLAMLNLKENRFDQAKAAMNKALQIDKALGDNSFRSVGEDLNDLALIYDKEEDFKKADATYKEALAAKEKSVGKDHYTVGTTLNNLADIEDRLGHKEDSERLKSRADRIWLSWLGGDFNRYPDDMQRYRQLTKMANSDYERPNADTRFDGLRPYLGRY